MGIGLGCIWPEEGALFSFHEGRGESSLTRGQPLSLYTVTTLAALCTGSAQCIQGGKLG